MHKRILLIFLLNMLLLAEPFVFANKRILGYTTATITLTRSQERDLEFRPSYKGKPLRLTTSQSKFLESVSQQSIDTIIVYGFDLAQNINFEDSAGFGIQNATNQVEIPLYAIYGSTNNSEYKEPTVPNKYYQNRISRYQKFAVIFIIIGVIGIVSILKRKRKKE